MLQALHALARSRDPQVNYHEYYHGTVMSSSWYCHRFTTVLIGFSQYWPYGRLCPATLHQGGTRAYGPRQAACASQPCAKLALCSLALDGRLCLATLRLGGYESFGPGWAPVSLRHRGSMFSALALSSKGTKLMSASTILVCCVHFACSWICVVSVLRI